MTQTQTLVLLTTVLLQIKFSISKPADLGAFGQNDVQPGVIYSFPSEVGRGHAINDYYALAFINYTYIGADKQQVVYAQEAAKYGEGPISSVSGQLVHVTNSKNKSDHTACSNDILGTDSAPLPPKGTWIALIKRGDCKFEDKIARVYSAGAIGAIVYDSKEVQSLDKMKIDNRSRNITSVFTYKKVGEQMAKIVDEEKIALEVHITPGKFGKPPNINRTSVLFVSISFIVLMIISFVWLVFYYVQRFRYLQTKDRKSRQLCTVAKRVISKIPTKSIKGDEAIDSDNDCCAICIEPYKTSDLIRVLPCKHEFHKNCIDPWLLDHRTCPMCKMDILKHYGFVVGSQNQIININGFILGVSPSSEPLSSDSVQSPTTSPAITTTQNQNQNQSQIQNQNHSALTQAMATHLIRNTNDNDSRVESLSSIMRTDPILAISPTLQSQTINNINYSNSTHKDHLDVDGSCSNRCNSRLSSANNHMDNNTRLSHSSCSNSTQNCNANVCTYSSFIDNTSHPNRNAKANNISDSSSCRRVSDV